MGNSRSRGSLHSNHFDFGHHLSNESIFAHLPPIHSGILNETGTNNCFLNAVIQALWHVSSFRKLVTEKPVQTSSLTTFSILKDTFIEYEVLTIHFFSSKFSFFLTFFVYFSTRRLFLWLQRRYEVLSHIFRINFSLEISLIRMRPLIQFFNLFILRMNAVVSQLLLLCIIIPLLPVLPIRSSDLLS